MKADSEYRVTKQLQTLPSTQSDPTRCTQINKHEYAEADQQAKTATTVICRSSPPAF